MTPFREQVKALPWQSEIVRAEGFTRVMPYACERVAEVGP